MKFLGAILAAVLIAGCASTGARYDAASVKKIRPGVTSERDLQSWFGTAFRSEQIADGQRRLTWQYTHGAVMVGVTEQHVLIVVLRPDGKVESFEERNK